MQFSLASISKWLIHGLCVKYKTNWNEVKRLKPRNNLKSVLAVQFVPSSSNSAYSTTCVHFKKVSEITTRRSRSRFPSLRKVHLIYGGFGLRGIVHHNNLSDIDHHTGNSMHCSLEKRCMGRERSPKNDPILDVDHVVPEDNKERQFFATIPVLFFLHNP